MRLGDVLGAHPGQIVAAIVRTSGHRADLAFAPGQAQARPSSINQRGGSHRHGCAPRSVEEDDMPESVYKVIELVGTSSESWEKAATTAIERASKTLRDLRVAEVVQQDLVIEDGKVRAYRAKVNVSFKYED
jgi:flavin-binding protein dodecin